MSVLTERPGVMSTAAVGAQQPPPVISCTVSALLDTTICRGSERDAGDERGQQQAPLPPPSSQAPACRSGSPRPSNGLTFARRRHSKSVDSPYVSRPRMKRRGAVSYDSTDAAAEYIRYLGDALSQQHRPAQTHTQLAELPANKLSPLSVPSRRNSRRGSIQNHTSQQCYKELLKGSILQRVGAEEQVRLIQVRLRKGDRWEFNVFAFRRLTGGQPLFHMGLHLLQKHNLITYWKLDIMRVMKFLAQVESAYHPDNCYHNCTHAADVTQALHCLIMEPKLYDHVTPLELLAILIAALCHDLDHPGVNQSYLLNTSSYLATIHGSTSILEQHHCKTAKAIVNETGLLDHLPSHQRKEITSLMEELILSTDFTRHKTFMATFEEMLISDQPIDLADPTVRKFILVIAIKAADVSNPTRPLEISRVWSEHIMEEFFRQGDSERLMKLPISYMCDRHTISLPKSQSGFMEFCVLPLYKAWSKLFGSKFSISLCQNIVSNKTWWDQRIPPSTSDSEDDT